MPLYEYECTQCKRHTEKIQKFSDAEITACPHCGGPLKRVITAPAIAFKGGGWYKDGYGNAAPTPAKTESSTDSGTSASASSDAPASSSSDSKSSPAPSAPASAPAPAAAPAAASSSNSDKK
jgi:putative FmdB family regulatory protein